METSHFSWVIHYVLLFYTFDELTLKMSEIWENHTCSIFPRRKHEHELFQSIPSLPTAFSFMLLKLQYNVQFGPHRLRLSVIGKDFGNLITPYFGSESHLDLICRAALLLLFQGATAILTNNKHQLCFLVGSVNILTIKDYILWCRLHR